MKRLMSMIGILCVSNMLALHSFLIRNSATLETAQKYDRKKFKVEAKLFVRSSGKKDRKISFEEFLEQLRKAANVTQKDIWAVPLQWAQNRDVFYYYLNFLIPKDEPSQEDEDTYDMAELAAFKKATGFAYVFPPILSPSTTHDSDDEAA